MGNVSYCGLQHFQAILTLTNMVRLDISSCTLGRGVDFTTISRLTKLKKVRSLSSSSNTIVLFIQSVDLELLSLPQLDISSTKGIPVLPMRALASLPYLRTLYLSGAEFEEFPEEPLSLLSSLRTFHMNNSELSEEGRKWARTVRLNAEYCSFRVCVCVCVFFFFFDFFSSHLSLGRPDPTVDYP
jgi:Leucine-rich repeat (LRR) protein